MLENETRIGLENSKVTPSVKGKVKECMWIGIDIRGSHASEEFSQ